MHMQTMFLCVPLRLGILAVASFCLLNSIIYCFTPGGWENGFRQFVGGYSLGSKVAVGVMQVTGVLFCLLGVLGTWYVKSNYVFSFNVWQFARLAVWIYVYVVDIPLIVRCEDWVNNIKGSTAKFGWNQTMYDIAMNGECSSERTSFFVASILTLLFFMYTVLATSRYQEHMDRVPKHLLRVPKDLSSGAFYAHSMGERKAVQGYDAAV